MVAQRRSPPSPAIDFREPRCVRFRQAFTLGSTSVRRFMLPLSPNKTLALVFSAFASLLLATWSGGVSGGGVVGESTVVIAAEIQDYLEPRHDNSTRDLTHVAANELPASTARACRPKTVAFGFESDILPHWAGVCSQLSRLPSRERQRSTGLAWVSLHRRNVRLEI